MTREESEELGRAIDAGGGRFGAAVLDAGDVSLVLLYDREAGRAPTRTAIRDPAQYLQGIENGSPHVENDPVLRAVLRRWLRDRATPPDAADADAAPDGA